jgi:3-oxoacyl-[acyl-carrier-protein] synthase II
MHRLADMLWKRVVVTGMGVASPIGIWIPEFEKWLKEGKDWSVHLDQQRLTEFDLYEWLKTDRIAPVCTAKELDSMLINLGLHAKVVKRMSRAQKLWYIAWREARKSAWLISKTSESSDVSSLPTNRGIIIASGMGWYPELADEVYRKWDQAKQKWKTVKYSPFMMTRSLIGTQAEQLITELDIQWIVSTHSEACAAWLMALGEAYDKIILWRQDIIVVLGTEATISSSGTWGFDSMRALAHSQQGSTPFDPSRNGFVEAEWAGALILESYQSAMTRGAPILAELKAVGTAVDSYHVVAPNPQGNTGTAAMHDAIAWSQWVKKRDVDLIQTHGTSTPAWDIAEATAIRKVFWERNIPLITANKSQLWHAKWASAILSAIAAILNINGNFVNPIINTQEIDPKILELINQDRFVVGNTYHDVGVNNVLVNAFAFGRTGASALFAKV